MSKPAIGHAPDCELCDECPATQCTCDYEAVSRVLEKVEWAGTRNGGSAFPIYYSVCVDCGASEKVGHAPDCELARLLGREEKC